MKEIGYVLLFIAGCCGLLFALTFTDYSVFKFWAPKYEAVRRETFEQSKAYNQGMVQELQNMQFQYLQADKEHQAALASLILHRAADYDVNAMPPDLATFISGLRRSKDLSR